MAKSGHRELPPFYAMVQPGLEEVAGEEITRAVGGVIKKIGEGYVVFRIPEPTTDLLDLRTVEDVYVLAWGTDQLTFRAEDLEKMQRWTAREPDWNELLRIHHQVHPKPKGKPTYWLVTQMEGEHGYLRRDARKALALGLQGKFPPSWKPAEDNASVEVWLTINNASAICGLRLSDRTMRHRTYKLEHRPASLRPTVAAAMVRLAEIRPRHAVLDPMCGAGTILAEHLMVQSGIRADKGVTLGADLDLGALRSTAGNLRKLGQAHLLHADARKLPIASQSIDRIVTNPPFGKQLSDPEEIGPLYQAMIREYDRLLLAGGMAVILVSAFSLLREAAREVGWKLVRQVRMRVLGQRAVISIWQKGS